MNDIKEIRHICRLRSTLEALAVSLWRERGRDHKVEEQWKGLLEKMRAAAASADYPEFYRLDHELHQTLIVAAGIDSLLRSWEMVTADINEWVAKVQRDYWPSLMALYREHVFLLDAWTGHDDLVAADACHHHLEAGWYRLAALQHNPDFLIDPVDRAVAFVSTHFSSHLEMEWVARHVSFLSTSHFNRLFRKRTGEPPHQFLKNLRLDRAAQILRSDTDAVSVIAQRVGYRNTSHFVRDFRSKFGSTPLAYRQHEA
jgi:AraC-like DNA-binding protein